MDIDLEHTTPLPLRGDETGEEDQIQRRQPIPQRSRHRVALKRQDRHLQSGHPDKSLIDVSTRWGFFFYVPRLHPLQQTNSKFYVGQTQDLTNRLIEHNSGESKSTSGGRPWTMVWSTQHSSRSEAMKLEKKIKSRGARRFLSDQGIAWR
jgi:putative endonuclease